MSRQLYIGDIVAGSSAKKDLISSIGDKFDISFVKIFPRTADLNFSMQMRADTGDSTGYFFVSEFPGNCSIFIISHFQDIFYLYGGKTEMVENIIKFAINLAREFEYAGFIISTTTGDLVEYLEESWDFVPIIEGMFNPHSEKENWFMLKRVKGE